MDANGPVATADSGKALAPERPLEGIRVLDLTDASGYTCGRILADLGADVVKVEPPVGDPGRWVGPFAEDRRELERGLVWLAGNVNKRGITCDLEHESGRAMFRRLVERADVVVESFEPGYLDRLGLGYEALAADQPGLILTSITPFGADGPRADWPASDLEVNAASGCLWLAGDPDRPPVRTTLPTSPGWAGMCAAMGTLVAVLARDATGLGQWVDLSAQESLITAIAHAPLFWDLLREEQHRSGPFLTGRNVSGTPFRNIWPCRDGFVAFALYGGPAGRQTGKAMTAWMEELGGAADGLERVDWDRFDVAAVTPEEVAEIEGAIGPFLLKLTRQEFFRGVLERNMLGYPVATVDDIWQDEQLRAREFWTEIEVPWKEGGSLPFPGTFVLYDGVRSPIRRRAPRLGEHNEEVYGEEPGLGHEVTVNPLREGVKVCALAGLRVIELGGWAAGPVIGKHLANQGAEVIRIESRRRLDGFRTNYPPFKDNIPGPERAAIFNYFNEGKRSIALNLKHPRAIELARRLIAGADVVVENFTPGTMARLGLGYDVLAQQNSRLVMLSTCNQGQRGPHAQHAGFGTHLTALSGFTQLLGYPDRSPALLYGPYIDFIAVGYGTIAVLAALRRRNRTGRGCCIDLSQYEAGLQVMAPALLDLFANGRVQTRAGNRHPTAAPHAVFSCRGSERWVALSVDDDAEWQRFVKALDHPTWACDPSFATAEGRKANEERLEALIAAWTAERDRDEVVDRLTRQRVKVYPVNSMADLFSDPQLAHRGTWRPVDHPVLGRVHVAAPPFRLSRSPCDEVRPAPLLGGDNGYVLGEILGLECGEIAELEAEGALE